MPDPKRKLVKVKGVGVIAFPPSMPDVRIVEAIKSHVPAQSTQVRHESPQAQIPPELERIQNAINPKVIPAAPYGNAISSVDQNEPHVIEVNDRNRWNQAPRQEYGHELTHLWQNQLPGPLRNAAPADDPEHPYDLSKIDEWRAQGKTLSTIPREAAAAIVQRWIADPSQRAKLQPWLSDLNSTPLSIMDATGPNDATINRHPRAPIPPIEAYQTPAAVLEKARKRQQ